MGQESCNVDLSQFSFLDEVEAIWGRRWGAQSEPGVVVLPAGNPVTSKALKERGVEVIELDMSEFVKTGGGPHCATAGLIRAPGPYLPR